MSCREATLRCCEPLYEAIRESDTKTIKRLLKSGIDVNARAVNGKTALHFASLVRIPFAVKVLETLLNGGADIHATADDGTTPLHLAALYKCTEAVKFLLDHGVDVNCQEKISHFSPLHLAAYAGCTEIIDLLISRGAQVDQPAKDNVTPLHLASIRGCLKTVNVLVEHGASVKIFTKSGQHTMLHVALMDKIEDVKKITNFEDNKSQRSFDLESIQVVDFIDRERVYKQLVLHGVNLQAQDSSGRTALHFAACNNINHTVRWILSLGAYLHLKDNKGYLAFHYVLTHNNMRGLWDLIKFGADINDIRVIKSSLPTIMKEKIVASELIRHLLKLKVANLFIANIYKPYINDPSYHVFQKNCVSQVAEMKLSLVQGSSLKNKLSIYDFLHMAPKRRQLLIRNRGIKAADFIQFPFYSGVIKASFQESLYWNLLLNKAIPAFYEIIGINLPELCVIEIFSHLDSYTLRTIIETID